MQNVPQPESGFAEIAGAPVYYEVAGAGPLLVFIHEGLADSRMFDDQFADFARQYRVLRYDLPGFGRSGVPAGAYSHYAALRALLDHIGGTRAALVGMSLGGAIAVDFTLTYPGVVGALVLLASGLGGYPPDEASAALLGPIREAFQTGDFARGIDLSVRIWVDGPGRGPQEVDPAVRERLRQIYTDVLRRSREQGRPADPLDPPAYGRLGEIGAPTLVVVGAGDVPVVVGTAEWLAQQIRGAQTIALPHLGHLLNMEQPAAVNRIVLDFLREHYSQG